MKVSELRIGNFLVDSLSGELLKVVDIKEPGFTTSVVDRSKFPLPKGWQAMPIPLTEEWLLKFGLEKREDSGSEYFAIQIGNNLNLTVCLKDKAAGIDLEWRSQGSQIWIMIDSVHKLQNIFFSLTGEELTLTDA